MKNEKLYILILIGLIFMISGCVGSGVGPPPQEPLLPFAPEETMPSILDDLRPSGQSTETLVLDSLYFPKSQFHISNNPQDNCGAAHYHADLATSVCGETKTDPAPESCGFGKVSEVPVKVLAESEIEAFCAEKDFETEVDCKGGGSETGKDKLSDEDLKKYDKAHKEVKPLTQPQSTTCGPASGAMDLVYWNDTLYPGLVTVDPESLIRELAKRMETSGVHGTKGDKMALGLADYLEEHAKGKLRVKLTYVSLKPGNTYTKTVRGSPVVFERTDSITVGDLGAQMDKKANIIAVHVREDDKKAHARKIVALDTKGEKGKHKVAFADPERGEVIEVEMDYDGTFLDSSGDKWRLAETLSVTPA